MDFQKQKQAVLGRKDKSIIGEIDPKIVGLVLALNSLEDYYTTSSCSGRIGLLHRIARHKGMEWVFKSHAPLSKKERSGLKAYFIAGEEVWFRQEQLILHVCCSSLGSAQRLILAAQKAGFKRPGIIALSRRIIVEIKNDNIINALVAGKGG
jgi:tRNA wybutosine-synthesizing protein 3